MEKNALSVLKHSNKPDDITDEVWLKQNKIAKGIIIRNLSDSLVGCVTNQPDITAYEIFQKLDGLYMRKSLQTELAMEMKLITLKYDEKESLQNHINTFDELVNEMEAASGERIKETSKIARLLATLPKTYSQLKISIQMLTDDKLSLSFVKIKLLEYEIELKNERSEVKTLMATTSDNNAFNNKKRVNKTHYNNQYKYKTNRNFKQFNKNTHNKINKFSKYNNYQKKKCEHCGRNNHLMQDCYYKLKNNIHPQQQQVQNTSNTAYIQQMEDDHFVFMLQNNNNRILNHVTYKLNDQNYIRFILDSGSTDHIVNNVDVFTTVTDLDQPIFIKTAKNNQILCATKKGTINIETEAGFKGTLNEVLYANELPYNLLLISKIQQHGIDVTFYANGEVLFKRNGQVILKTMCNKNLSVVTFKIEKKCIANNAVRNVLNKYKLWHERLGHIGKVKFQELKENSLTLDSQILKSVIPTMEICEPCIKSKQTKLAFNKKKDRSHIQRPLFAIHSDVCGPISPQTIDGKNYFVTFIDEFTHYTVVYLITSKSDVFRVFKDYVNKSEAFFNLKIAFMYCDNGKEYLSNEFKTFCSEKGIQYHITVPYTPQQNSIAERMNRTLVEKARAMIYGAKLSKEFWGEAVLTATYIVNIFLQNTNLQML